LNDSAADAFLKRWRVAKPVTVPETGEPGDIA